MYLEIIIAIAAVKTFNIIYNYWFKPKDAETQLKQKIQTIIESLCEIEQQLQQKIADERNNENQLNGEVEKLLCKRSELELEQKILNGNDTKLTIELLKDLENELKSKQNLLESELNEDQKNLLTTEVENLLLLRSQMELNIIKYDFIPDHDKFY